MNNTPTKPGQRCRVVGSRSKENGEGDGPNIGKVVITQHMYALRAGLPQDSVAVWRCKSADGHIIATYHGGTSDEADFLSRWLEVEDEQPVLPMANQEHKELSK